MDAPRPQYSPDGRWWWDGGAWQPVPVAAPAQYSPDGRFLWNGNQWQPLTAASTSPTLGSEYFGATVIAVVVGLISLAITDGSWGWPSPFPQLIAFGTGLWIWSECRRSIRRRFGLPVGPRGSSLGITFTLGDYSRQAPLLIVGGVVAMVAGGLFWFDVFDVHTALDLTRIGARGAVALALAVGGARRFIRLRAGRVWGFVASGITIVLTAADGALFLLSGALRDRGEPWTSIANGYFSLVDWPGWFTHPGFYVFVAGYGALVLGRWCLGTHRAAIVSGVPPAAAGAG